MWFHCRLYQLPPRSAVICWLISWGQCCGSKKLPSSDTSPQIHSGSRVLFCQPLGMRHEGQVCDAERYKIAPGSSVAGNCYSCSYLGSGKLIQPIKTEQLAWEWKFLCCVFGSSTPNRLWMGMSLLSPRKCQCCFLQLAVLLPGIFMSVSSSWISNLSSVFGRNLAISELEMSWESSRHTPV